MLAGGPTVALISVKTRCRLPRLKACAAAAMASAAWVLMAGTETFVREPGRTADRLGS